MCYPNSTELKRRERMVGTIQRQTGVNEPRRSPLDSDTFRNEVRLHSGRGQQIGGLLLTMIQLRSNGVEPSLRLAIKLQTDTLLPGWVQPVGPYWHTHDPIEHLPRSRGTILRNARHYAPVAHLWAAHLHSVQASENPLPGDLPSWPDSIEGFLRLLGYAAVFRKLEADARPPRGTGRSFFGGVDAWRAIVPRHMIVAPSVRAMPLPSEWMPILTSYRTLNC